MIYTTYFAKLNKLPSYIVPISICSKAPNGYKGLQYKKLAPGYDLLMKYKQDHDSNYYIKNYNERVLASLDAQTILKELTNMANTESIALICYEKPTDFCHRHLVSEWFRNNGIDCYEADLR